MKITFEIFSNKMGDCFVFLLRLISQHCMYLNITKYTQIHTFFFAFFTWHDSVLSNMFSYTNFWKVFIGAKLFSAFLYIFFIYIVIVLNV